MKCTVPRKDLAKAVRLAVAATEAKSATPVLASALLVADRDRLTITGTDLMVGASVSVACKVDKPGRTLVVGKQLAAAVAGLTDGDVAIDSADGRVEFKAGKSRQRILGGMAEDFPATPTSDGCDLLTVPAPTLLAAFAEGSVSMSTDESRAYIACAFLEIADGILRVVSTDGHTLANRESVFDGSFTGVTIPQKSAIDVRRTLEAVGDGDVQIGAKLGYLFLVADGIEVSVKLGDGAFIPYTQVIPKSKKRRASVPREATLAAIKRVLANIADASPTAQLTFADGTLSIRSSTKDAEASDTVDIDYAGGDFRISANGAYLIRALGVMAHDEVWIDSSSDLDPLVFRGRDSTESVHVIMPVRA